MQKTFRLLLTLLVLAAPIYTHSFEVYFNFNSDDNCGDTHLDEKFGEFISGAEYTLDICFYTLTLYNVCDSIISAHDRGVSVRVIIEADNSDYSAVERLEEGGITVIDDWFPGSGGSGFMHNKFAIRDSRDSSSFNDDYLWTGSWNASYTNTFYDANNVIVIQDHNLARQYTLEFDEMWGSQGETPNSSNSKFHTRKVDNISHSCYINGSLVEVYMSPSDGATAAIVDAVKSADHEILFCIMAFTSDTLESAMKNKWDQISNFRIKGVFDGSMWNNESSASINMRGLGDNPWSLNPEVLLDSVNKPEDGILHHKYMIIDGHYSDSDPTVITGSMNWSTNGECTNDENTLIIHNADVARAFINEFNARFREAGGVTVPQNILVQNFPNPFTYTTTIYFHLDSLSDDTLETDEKSILRLNMTGSSNTQKGTVKIVNIVGKTVKTYQVDRSMNKINWDGTDESGQELPSGLYFYHLTFNKHEASKKMIYLREGQ
ncbi:gliding motility-associated C-terminal domain-containing protein [bacterium]|nr:gliding motility-associated C-terminal domain-containing protein [bacterium]